MVEPKEVKNCKLERDKQGKCRKVCEDENGKKIWKFVSDGECGTK